MVLLKIHKTEKWQKKYLNITVSRPILKIAVTRLEDREFIISNHKNKVVGQAKKSIKISQPIY